MAIVSSTYVEGGVEVDARKYVTETHTDHLGATYVVSYLWSNGIDKDAVMSARATKLAADIATDEFENAVNGS